MMEIIEEQHSCTSYSTIRSFLRYSREDYPSDDKEDYPSDGKEHYRSDDEDYLSDDECMF